MGRAALLEVTITEGCRLVQEEPAMHSPVALAQVTTLGAPWTAARHTTTLSYRRASLVEVEAGAGQTTMTMKRAPEAEGAGERFGSSAIALALQAL